MRAKYDAETDILTLVFSDALVVESDEEKPGVILDFDARGNLVSMEVMDASKRVSNPKSFEFAVAG